MNALLTARIKLLIAQSNCPACGQPIVSGGGGIAFAISTFACGAEFVISNEQISVSRACPSASHVAATHLNKQAEAQLAQAGAK